MPNKSRVSRKRSIPKKYGTDEGGESSAKTDGNDKRVSEVTSYQCNHCLMCFASSEKAERHVEECHAESTTKTKQILFECDRCGLSCATSGQYLQHRTSCVKQVLSSSEGSFTKCARCDEVLISAQDHFRLKHSENSDITTESASEAFQCCVCGISLSSLTSWLRHVQNHSIEKSFDCLICHSKFYTQAEFLVHIVSHPLNRAYKCQQCPETFSLPLARDRHVKNQHRFKCKLCANRNYKHHRSLLKHMKLVHSVDEPMEEGKTVKEPARVEEEEEEEGEETALDEAMNHDSIFDPLEDGEDASWSDDNKGKSRATRSARKSKTARAVNTEAQESFPCDLCDDVFPSSKRRREHFARDHQGKVHCIPCNLTFNHRRGLRRHRIRCHGPKNESYVCEVCGKAFKCSYALATHRRVHYATKKHGCSVCGMKFLRAENMRRHEARHSGHKPFMCDVCGSRYTTKFMLQKHAEIHVEDKDKIYLCENCGEGFSRTNILKFHIQSDCGKARRSESVERPTGPGLSYKGRIPGVSSSRSRQLLPYPCPMCRKGFKEKEILDRHVKSFHTNDEKLVCDVCGIRFRTEVTLNVHKAIHTSKKYKCEYCNKEFLRETLKQIHEREKHTGERPHKCKFCDESFTRKGRLAAHQLVHYGREIKCDYCDMIFAKIDTKMKHMKKHTNQRPFVCNVCSKAFKEKYNLEIHMRTHSSQKPYSCLKCKKRFTDAAGLENHLQIHEVEPVTSYECDICGQLFLTSADLVSHSGSHTDQTQGECPPVQSDNTQRLELTTTQVQGHTQPILSSLLCRINPLPIVTDAFSAPTLATAPQQSIQQLQIANPEPRTVENVQQTQTIDLQKVNDEECIIIRQPLPSNQVLQEALLRQRDDSVLSGQQLDSRIQDQSGKAFEMYLLDQFQRSQISVDTTPRQNLVPETLVMQRAAAPSIIVDNLQTLPRAPNFSMDGLQRPQNFIMDPLTRPAQITIMDPLQRPQVWNLNPGT